MHDIITVGTATRDAFLTSNLFKTIKDAKHLKKNGFLTGEAQCFALGGKIEVNKPIFTTGGGATNAAITFARQNLNTAAMVVVGKDEAAQSIIKELQRESVKPLTIQENGKGTAHSTILLSDNGERTILVYRGASEDLKISSINFKNLKAHWVYISPGKISVSVIEKITDYLASKNILIAINPSKYFIENREKIKPILEKCKVVILNREEAAYLTNEDFKKEKEIFKKLDKAISGIIVMTDGPNGVLVSDGNYIYKAGVFKEKKIIDRTGAGDAFASGFVSGLIHLGEKCEKGLCRVNNIEYAIRLGSANATSVVEHIGAKAGILKKQDFEKSPRWKNLNIKILKIN